MSEEPRPGALDRLVERLAAWMTALGLNGTRLLWKWNRRRARIAEAGAQTEVLLRSAKGRHKMCRSCRALVDRSASTCPECGETLSGVRAPGVGRMVANILPGVTAASSLIMLVNGFWFVIMLMAQMKAGSGETSLFGGFGSELIVRFGSGLSRERLLSNGSVVGGEWWRLVTPIFLHGGMIHFLFNSYLLIQLGPIVEGIFGTTRFWVIYLCCGIAGSMASQLPRFVNTVGASGAIMGLIGLLVVYGYRTGGVLGQSMNSLVVRLALYSIVLGFMFNIDHLNHIGGFLCGAGLALIVPDGSFRDRNESRLWTALSTAGVLLVLLAFYQVALQGRLTAGP